MCHSRGSVPVYTYTQSSARQGSAHRFQERACYNIIGEAQHLIGMLGSGYTFRVTRGLLKSPDAQATLMKSETLEGGAGPRHQHFF